MNRVLKIVNHKMFQVYLSEIEKAERDRDFCRHDMTHFLDVARIAMILNLEDQLDINQEYIYAAALLHDIGRHMEYREGIPHEQASAVLAPAILRDCGFDEMEMRLIIQAISSHRNKEIAQAPTLSGILYRADKMSRPCFCCVDEGKCEWENEKKNLQIIY